MTAPALIVGAGPAGLTTAIALARAGVGCVLVERRSELSSLPRATSVSVRTMEILRAWGLEDEVRAGGPEVEWQMWECETLTEVASGSAIDAGIPSRAASALVSPTVAACVPQDHVEAVLLRYLRSLPAATVQLGTEVVALDAEGDGFEVKVRRANGEMETLRAGYLVGADGTHGVTRDLLGIDAWDSGRLQPGVTALFHAPLWELVGEHRYGLYTLTHPGAPGIFLPAGLPNRWIYGALPPEGRSTDDVTDADLRRAIRIGSGVGDLDPRIEQVGRFSLTVSLAETFRRERGFLVGDAAHRVTPRGGTGMNMAMQGAFNLGWKLAWVLNGWAGPDLLDSYESERRPIVEHNIARSVDPAGSTREAATELQVDLGGRIPHVWAERGDGRRSVLDLVGEGLTLFTGDAGSWAAARRR